MEDVSPDFLGEQGTEFRQCASSHIDPTDTVRRSARLLGLALNVNVIMTPPCIIISLVVLHRKYTGWHDNDLNVYT